MLSYQHIYHAGNFADVQKHALLIQLIRKLTAQHALLHVLDTHAGRGFYDLSSAEAQKTGEHLFGITPLWQNRRVAASGLIGDYLNALAPYNKTSALLQYPGSARIARDHLRETDTLIAAERHPREFQELQKAFRRDDPAMTDLFHDDGLTGLSAATPEGDASGLIVIDPSYEVKNDYTDVPRALVDAWGAWQGATALIWYPMLPAGLHNNLLAYLKESPLPDTVVSEIFLTRPPKAGYRMEGSGIAIVNCPWSEAELAQMTQDIADALTPACGPVEARAYTL